ncbi:hypothetical protein [Halopseudomonas oceani]|uniref:hypothetical protein n=1 Tax=Halopseudomonas oceani TaxID=1708783 RepID=UPI002AA62C38|nr:hypothetical protein [Halopseudomonas oceani]
MAKYKIAHIREQGQDMIIVPLDSSFNLKSQHDQNEVMDALQAAATSAGLAGHVVLIWKNSNTVRFMAPPQWHPFFKSPGIYQLVMSNLNKELTIY